jgi:hypothetical protein
MRHVRQTVDRCSMVHGYFVRTLQSPSDQKLLFENDYFLLYGAVVRRVSITRKAAQWCKSDVSAMRIELMSVDCRNVDGSLAMILKSCTRTKLIQSCVTLAILIAI